MSKKKNQMTSDYRYFKFVNRSLLSLLSCPENISMKPVNCRYNGVPWKNVSSQQILTRWNIKQSLHHKAETGNHHTVANVCKCV